MKASEFLKLLPSGSTRIRRARHGDVWRLPNGAIVTLPCHDHSVGQRGLDNYRASIKRALRQGPSHGRN